MSEEPEFYTAGARKFQAQNDGVGLADAMIAAIVTDHLSDDRAEFIATRDFFFLATVNSGGEPTVSYKGGAPGFVKIVSPTKLAFFNRGRSMAGPSQRCVDA